MDEANHGRTRRLIEEWLPIAEIGIESVRERTPMTPFPAPNRLHVWFARRPLVASRAAILASLLPADADREKFRHVLGIHGDPVASRVRIDEAKRTGERFAGQAYSYPRAFTYTPNAEDREWITSQVTEITRDGMPTVADLTAGGGSIPLEALRLGLPTIANDLNPVAWLILKATIEFPARFGPPLLKRFRELAAEFIRRRDERLAPFFPPELEPDCVATNWLWARTIRCPYCDGLVPLSPNWKLDGKGTGVRIVPHTDDSEHRHCTFEIVNRTKDHSSGTVNAGNALCPYPDCGRVIDGDEHVKLQAQSGQMGQQLYAVVYKRRVVTGHTKKGKPKIAYKKGFRAPRRDDEVEEQVRKALESKIPEWEARAIIPFEEIDRPSNYDRGHRLYGIKSWREMFAPRQLYGQCTSVETFQDLVQEVRDHTGGQIPGLHIAALTYLAIAIDKVTNYNALASRWDTVRRAVRGTFDRHNFAMQWSFGEMAPTVAGLGYDWAIQQTEKALEELISFCVAGGSELPLVDKRSHDINLQVWHGPADSLGIPDASVDSVVIDPPYYANVMYAELSDFFYVWLKRTAGLFFPDVFSGHLTDKDREAVANLAKFKDEKHPEDLAFQDYERRMGLIFAECRRVLKPDGIMVVMFTHKASGAWDALASGLVRAGFVITASWPVNTEAEGSLHIKEKSAARSTIFLVCRVREKPSADSDPVYWEDVEPRVAETVRRRVGEFQAAGIGGIDLYLASFGPALQVFSESWPLTRGRPVTRTNGKKKKAARPEDDDPYAVRPEDALDAARREVKQWRLDQLATIKRQHHLDPLTEWYILAWDAFKAPRFPVDEALKLARVAGLDFDREVKNEVCEAKSRDGDVTLWDSLTRKRKGKLGPVGGPAVIDTLHQAAALVREQNTGAAQAALEQAGLLNDATLMTALETLLNVLPPPALAGKGKADGGLSGAASDFEALEKLRRLAFAESVPPPQVQLELTFPVESQQTLALVDDEEIDETDNDE